jgi:hypothetical protein
MKRNGEKVLRGIELLQQVAPALNAQDPEAVGLIVMAWTRDDLDCIQAVGTVTQMILRIAS